MVKKGIRIAAVIAAVVLAVFYYNIHSARTAASGAIETYNELARSYNEKIEKYNAAASGIGSANETLQGVLNEAGALVDQNKKAYEPETLKTLKKAIKTAEGSLVEVPVQFDPFEIRELQNSFNKNDFEIQKLEADAAAAAVKDAMTKIPEIPEVPDYKEQIEAVRAAQKSYQNSVQKLANVTAPSDTFVNERIRRIGTVVETGAVTKDQDPNGLLGEKGGYIGCIYFLDERVDRELLPKEAFKEVSEEQNEKKKEVKGAEDGFDSAGEDTDPSETAAEAAASGATAGNAGTAAEAAAAGATAGNAADGATTEAAAGTGSSGEKESSAAVDTTLENASEDGTAAGNAASTETSAASAVEEKEQGPEEVINVVLIGTIGGGAVEIFPTEEDAQARIEYLRFFEGSLMEPGAFDVEGTCVLRASKYLDVVEQKELIEKIREELLATDE